MFQRGQSKKDDASSTDGGGTSTRSGGSGGGNSSRPPPPKPKRSLSPMRSNDLSKPALPTRFMIADRLDKAVNSKLSTAKNRSPDLVPLTKDYEVLKKQLRSLLAATKAYHVATQTIEEARADMVSHLTELSENTPLFPHVGQKLKEKDVEDLQKIADSINNANSVDGVTPAVGDIASAWAKKNETAKKASTTATMTATTTAPPTSFAALHQLADMQGSINTHEFQTHILAYVEEWEAVVTTRIDQSLKETKKLQQDRTHYEGKVEKLRKTVNDLEAKGKSTPTSTAEKLERNEEKLKEAWEAHESSAARLCLLIEETTQRGWKELYHVVKNLMKWETNRVGRANDIYANVPEALESMKGTLPSNNKKKTGGAAGKKATKKPKPKKSDKPT